MEVNVKQGPSSTSIRTRTLSGSHMCPPYYSMFKSKNPVNLSEIIIFSAQIWRHPLVEGRDRGLLWSRRRYKMVKHVSGRVPTNFETCRPLNGDAICLDYLDSKNDYFLPVP